MDLARRRGGVPDLSSQSDLEFSASLAFPGAHAQYQGKWPRRGAFTASIFRRSNSSASSLNGAYLDHRSVGTVLLAAVEVLSLRRLELSDSTNRIHRTQGKGVLSRAHLSCAPGGRGGNSRLWD